MIQSTIMTIKQGSNQMNAFKGSGVFALGATKACLGVLCAGALSVMGCAGTSRDQTGGDGLDLPFDDLPGEAMDAPEMAFETQEELSAYLKESAAGEVTGDIGQTHQAWASARFHGTRDRGSAHISATPCYKDGGTYNCMFPTRKQLALFVDNSACPSGTNVSGTQNNLAFLGAVQGVHDAAAGSITVTDVSTAAQANVVLRCFAASDFATVPSGALAFADNVGNTHTQIANLPFNPVKAVQYDRAEIRVALDRFINRSVSLGADLFAVSRTVGLHETGHVLGFGHFTTGIMESSAAGQLFTQFPVVMQNALNDYSGNSSAASLLEDNLESMGL
jgi:hypothetical protein